MATDVSRFALSNIVDTCSIWNLLSSQRLLALALDSGVRLACTPFVVYECLVKPRRVKTPEDDELKQRLLSARASDQIAMFPIDVEDLQVVELLERRRRLGKGELSTIAFAMKTRQMVMTDDTKAIRLAAEFLPSPGAQTTPHLLGWLVYGNRLTVGDEVLVLQEHEAMRRPLHKVFAEMCEEGRRCRAFLERSMESGSQS
jgi:hypothetical protein